MSWKVLGSIAASILLSSLSGCTGALVVRTAPPPERMETVSVAPSTDHFWVRGHWMWNGNQYVWVTGRWEVRRAREVWVPGHWRAVGGGYVWEAGHWTTR